MRHPDAVKTDNPAKNFPSLEYYVRYLNATVGCEKTIDDMLNDSERLYILQKMINLRQGKGTRAYDQIPLRAMGPAFFNEYEARSEHYDQWLQEQMNGNKMPDTPPERHKLLMDIRIDAYQSLCDTVYNLKGFSQGGVPLPSTLERLDLIDDQARNLLDEFDI